MMTDEQKRLAEDNLKLVFFYINKNSLDFEEYAGILSEELCLSACDFDKERGASFATYVLHRFRTAVFNNEKAKRMKKRSPGTAIASLDKEIENDSNGAPTSLKDLVAGDDDTEGDAVTSLFMEELRDVLNDRYWKAVLLRMDGLTMDAIGKRMGVSRERVSKILKNVRAVVEELWEGG